MRIISWNVNGLRAVIRGGFWDWLNAAQPDVLCLQETRIQPEQLTPEMLEPAGYHTAWNAGERKGYSGVATFSRQPPLAVAYGFGQPYFDVEGRVLITEYPGFSLLNVYFPNGQRGQERVAYKLDFYDALLGYCEGLRAAGQSLVVCGDYNTAPHPIDLARPKENVKNSGFLPEEREAFARWMERGWVDAFRALHPDAVAYTWWNQRFGARERNIGWRIDMFLVTPELLPRVSGARVLSEVMGSDHCPVELTID